MRRLGLMLLVGVFAISGFARPASAILQFHKEFVNLYVEEDSDTDLAKLAKNKKLRCLICHQGKKKKNHNPYGVHLKKLLDKKEDKKNVEKIVASLEKVAAMPSDPDDENSPTFGELIKEGKIPGGTLEELQQEPEPTESEEASSNS